MRKSETVSARLRLPVTLINPDETPYSGSLSSPTILIQTPGTSTWTAIASQTLTAITGGHAATFYVQLATSEVATLGVYRYTVDVGTAVPFEGIFEVDDVENNQATILANQATALTAIAAVTTNVEADAATNRGTITTAITAAVTAIESDAATNRGTITTAISAGTSTVTAAISAGTSSVNTLAATNQTAALAAIASEQAVILAALDTAVSDIEADVAAIDYAPVLARLPAALDDSGFMKSQVKGFDTAVITAAAIATDAIAAAKIKADAVTKIVTGVLAGVVDGTATVKGVLARANSLILGKASGLVGNTVTFYLEDGATVAWQYVQNAILGTRAAATVKNGD